MSIDEEKKKNIAKNIAIILNGEKLCWKDKPEIPLSFVGIIIDDNSDEVEFDLYDFSLLEKYIEPKTREQELEERIAELEAQVAARTYGHSEPRQIKQKVVYDKNSKLEISKDWKAKQVSGEKTTLKDFAKKYNISTNYLSSILKEFGVYKPRKKNQTITAKVV